MKQICPIHRFSYEGNKCPFCEKERIDRLAQKYGKVIEKVEETKKDKPASEDSLKKLADKFNVKKR